MLYAIPGDSQQAAPPEIVLYIGLNANDSAQLYLYLPYEPPSTEFLEQTLQKMVGAPVHWSKSIPSDGVWTTVRFYCPRITRRQGLVATGQIDPRPITRLWPESAVRWFVVEVAYPHAPYIHLMSETPVALRHTSPYMQTAWMLLDKRVALSPLVFAYGYRTGDLLRLFLPLTAALLLPIGLTLWIRRKALAATGADPTAVWFSYFRVYGWITTGLWIVWLLLFCGLHLPTFTSYLVQNKNYQAISGALLAAMLVPPALVRVVCAGLSHPVFARVRGMEWTRGDLMRQSAWNMGAKILPALFVGLAIGAMLDSQASLAVLWFIAAYSSGVIGTRNLKRATGTVFSALTVGELRDRIFALAQKANVKIQQIYFLPAGKSRLANAFALQGNQVLLTDYLLQHLSKREIDAIAAHELTHLRYNHPVKLSQALMLTVVVPILLIVTYGAVHLLNLEAWLPFLPLFLPLGLLTFYFISRRFERVADKGAVTLTGDPEALITGLTKVMQFNQMPMEWGRWQERLATHPSTLWRVQAIAAQGGLAPERLQALLQHPVADPDRYQLPAGIAEQDRIFSTTFKAQVVRGLFWRISAQMIVPSALAAWLAKSADLTDIGLWSAWGLGIAATLAVYLLGRSRVAGDYTTLRRRLQDRLEQEGWQPEAWGGRFVGFAPDASPRVYEGFINWDIGCLFLTGDYLCYVGEQTRFALRREQVSDVRLGRKAPGWMQPVSLVIAWQTAERGTSGAFSLRPLGLPTNGRIDRAVRSLVPQIKDWQQGPSNATAVPEALAALPSPTLGVVTSQSMRLYATGRNFVGVLLNVLLLAVGLSVLLGLSFGPEDGGAAWYVLAVSGWMVVLNWLPFALYREPGGSAR